MSTKPAQLTNPQTHNNDWGSLFKFGSPPRSPFILHTSMGVSYTQSSAATVVHTGFKINARPSWSEPQQAADWQISPWTLTQIALGGGCVFHSICPRGIRCYISALLFSLPPTSTSCPHPLPSSSPSSSRKGRQRCGTVLSLCLEADRCKLVGSNNLWVVTLTSFPTSGGATVGQTSGRKKKGRALHESFCNMSEVMGSVSTYVWAIHRWRNTGESLMQGRRYLAYY